METIVLVICGLILGAVAIRVIIGSLGILYKVAPYIVIWAAIISLMYWFETGRPITELKDQNATITGTAEN